MRNIFSILTVHRLSRYHSFHANIIYEISMKVNNACGTLGHKRHR